MLGQPCKFRRDQHKILRPRLLNWIRRQVPAKFRDRLFIYHHLWYGTYVIAEWVVPGRVFQDVINLEYSLNNFDATMAREFKTRYCGALTRRELSRLMQNHDRYKQTVLQRENDISADYNEWRYNTTRTTVALGA